VKISKWYWASVFGQTYETGPSSRAPADFNELKQFIEKDEEPKALRKLYLNHYSLQEVTKHQRALYKGVISLVMSLAPRDLHKGDTINENFAAKNRLDDHHVFPRNWLKGKTEKSKADCVLNRTLIEKNTNIVISDSAPSI